MSVKLTKDAIVHIPETVNCTLVEDDFVLLDLDTGMFYGLDEVGERMWTLLSEGRKLGDVTETLLNEYDVEEDQLWQELQNFVEHLQQHKLIEVVVLDTD